MVQLRSAARNSSAWAEGGTWGSCVAPPFRAALAAPGCRSKADYYSHVLGSVKQLSEAVRWKHSGARAGQALTAKPALSPEMPRSFAPLRMTGEGMAVLRREVDAGVEERRWLVFRFSPYAVYRLPPTPLVRLCSFPTCHLPSTTYSSCALVLFPYMPPTVYHLLLLCACALSLHATYRLPLTPLWWEVHAAQEVLEPRVGTQTVESRLRLQPCKLTIALLIGLFEPLECPAGVA